jgi:hypothetical protein
VRTLAKYLVDIFAVSSVPQVAQVGIQVPYVIGGVVSGVVLLLCIGLLAMFCCCKKKKVVKKDYEMGRGNAQVVPPPYYTNGMENKGMERSMDVIEDTLKNFDQQNGYISYNGLHPHPNGNGSKWLSKMLNCYPLTFRYEMESVVNNEVVTTLTKPKLYSYRYSIHRPEQLL